MFRNYTFQWALVTSLFALLALGACGRPAYDPQDAGSIIRAMEAAMGGKQSLHGLQDVQFTYTYDQVSEGTKDISVERYRFADEASYGNYSVHKVHVAPKLDGEIKQSLLRGQTTVTQDGNPLTDPAHVGTATFLRMANYFWFTMMFKLGDPQTIYEVLPGREVNGTTYDVVKVTYDPEKTGKPVNDTYILYVNPETHLVDRFLFSLPAMGVKDPILLFEVEYTKMHGIQVITKRTMFGTDGEGNKKGPAQAIQSLSDIQFKNGFTDAQFL